MLQTIVSLKVAQQDAYIFISCTDHVEMVGSGSSTLMPHFPKFIK